MVRCWRRARLDSASIVERVVARTAVIHAKVQIIPSTCIQVGLVGKCGAQRASSLGRMLANLAAANAVSMETNGLIESPPAEVRASGSDGI